MSEKSEGGDGSGIRRGESTLVHRGGFGVGLALSYALFPSAETRRGIVARTVRRKVGTEIIFNLPGLLDWSDMGVRTGDAMDKAVLSRVNEVSGGEQGPTD